MSKGLYLWLARLSGDANKIKQARGEVRHALRQQWHDTRRRGQTNREGANNRRWRRYMVETDWRGTLIWPDYLLSLSNKRQTDED